MGRFYANLTLRTTNHAAVLEIARSTGRPSFVSAERRGSIVLFDGGEESDDPEFVHAQAELYSGSLDCAALGVINHDDSVLMYALYDRGELCDEYISSPEYFELDEETAALVEQGGDARMLARTLGPPDVTDSVERLLRLSATDEGGFEFEADRHAALVDVLGLNPLAVGTGFDELSEAAYPEGSSPPDFVELASAD